MRSFWSTVHFVFICRQGIKNWLIMWDNHYEYLFGQNIICKRFDLSSSYFECMTVFVGIKTDSLLITFGQHYVETFFKLRYFFWMGIVFMSRTAFCWVIIACVVLTKWGLFVWARECCPQYLAPCFLYCGRVVGWINVSPW